MREIAATLASSGWLRRVWAHLRVLRPVNIVMIMVGVALGGVLSGGDGALQGAAGTRLLWAALSAALIAGAANSLNDVLDLEIDRINRLKTKKTLQVVGWFEPSVKSKVTVPFA